VTALSFHFGVPDKLAYACRLVRKATASGAKVVVMSSADMVLAMDAQLWAISPTEFVTHCMGGANLSVKNRSQAVLVSDMGQIAAPRQILVNLSNHVPDGFEIFDRLIEVVSTQEQDRDSARHRWKHYVNQGYSITRHDISVKDAQK
jgi:DNA polymerase-3 subunit chi